MLDSLLTERREEERYKTRSVGPVLFLCQTALLIAAQAVTGGEIVVRTSSDAYCMNKTSQYTGTDTMCFGGPAPDYSTGLLFTNVTIPPGMVVTSAFLKVYAYKQEYMPGGGASASGVNSMAAKIDAENSYSASGFTNGAPEIWNRGRTTNSATWNIPFGAWGNGSEYASVDFSNVIQELVYTRGWPNRASIAIFINGSSSSTDSREIYSYEGSMHTNGNLSWAAMLTIKYCADALVDEKYIAGATNNPPSVPTYWNNPNAYYPDNPDGICWPIAVADILGYWDRTPYGVKTYWNLVDHGPAPNMDGFPWKPGHSQGDVYSLITNLCERYYGQHESEAGIIHSICNSGKGLSFSAAQTADATNNLQKIALFGTLKGEISAGRPLVASSGGTLFGGPHAIPVVGYVELMNPTESQIRMLRGDGSSAYEYVNPCDPAWGAFSLLTMTPGGTPVDYYEARGDNDMTNNVSLDPKHVYGFRQTHNFSVSGDQDWIKFTAETATDYTICTRNLGTNCDTFLALYYDGNPTPVAVSDDGGYEPRASYISWRAVAGGLMCVKAIAVSADNYGHNANYDLEIVGVSTTGTNIYVSPSGSHAPPFITWGTAATNIQAAVNIARTNDRIIVADGVYAPGAQIVITNKAYMTSVNGSAGTIVTGSGARRCFYIDHPEAVVEGFTMTGGVAKDGGGIYLARGTVKNCRIVNNFAVDSASGDYCQAVARGGGVFCATGLVEGCFIVSNQASAGAYTTNMAGGCSASAYGGGAYCLAEGTILNCLVITNSAHASSGFGMMSAAYCGGGGIYTAGLVRNCTVSFNSVSVVNMTMIVCMGAGVYGGTVRNSIVYSNFNAYGSTLEGPDYAHCCLDCPIEGAGNITNQAPGFVNASAQDFHLAQGSPCIDSGDASGAPADDLDCVPRPLDGDAANGAAFDMGAYEFIHPSADSDGDRMPDAWELAHNMSPVQTNGTSGPSTDLDNDGMSNLQEYLADTDPQSSTSCLELVQIALQGTNIMLEWHGGQASTQYLESRTSLSFTASAWTPIYTNLPPTVSNSLTRPVPASSNRFYRIRAVR